MKQPSIFFIILISTLTCFSITQSEAGVNIATVGPVSAGSCDHTSIEDALNHEPVYGEIRVVAGVYNEPLNIANKSVDLIGGYVDCAAAAIGDRVLGSMATLDATAAYGMLIFANYEEGEPRESIKIIGLNVINGSAGFSSSGGINIGGWVNVVLQESRIADNAGTHGGGIYAGSSSWVILQDTMVVDNIAENGGGFYCDGCELLVNGASGISGNSADGEFDNRRGGGLYLANSAEVQIYSGSKNPSSTNLGIHNNTARFGGGVYVDNSTLLLYGHESLVFGNATDPVNVTGNYASQDGGGIRITNGGVVNAVAVDISGNEAGLYSGAGISIYADSEFNISLGEPMLVDCWSEDLSKCNRINNNWVSHSDGYGSALAAFSGMVNINHVWFGGNYAADENIGSSHSGELIFAYTGNSDKLLVIKNSVMYANGHASDSSESLIKTTGYNMELLSTTIVDNNTGGSILDLVESIAPFTHIFSVENTIIHNDSGIPVLTTENDPDVQFNCVLVDDDSTLPMGSPNVFVGDPMFFDRANGNLHLTLQSDLAIDRCADPASIDFDMDLQDRSLNLFGLGNDLNNYTDIGADEYIGNDYSLDLIFTDGFDEAP